MLSENLRAFVAEGARGLVLRMGRDESGYWT